MDNKNQVFQVPGEISKIITMRNKSLRLQVDTQENVTAEQLKNLLAVLETKGWFTMVVRENDGKIKPDDIKDLPAFDINQFDIEKSPCTRLRAVMFVYFTKTGGNKKEFDSWYLKEMEKRIDQYKERIPAEEPE